MGGLNSVRSCCVPAVEFFFSTNSFPAVCDLSKGSKRAKYLILPHGVGDKIEQYTGIRAKCLFTGIIWSANMLPATAGHFPKTVSAPCLVERLSRPFH